MSGLIGPRIAALFGVAFAIFLFLGVALLEMPSEATDQEMIEWWSDSTNREVSMLSMSAVALSGISLLIFLSHMRDRLNANGRSAGNPMFALGTAAASVLFVTAAVRGTIANAVTHNEELPGVDLLRYMPELSYTLMEAAMLATGTSIILAACAMKATRTFPAWLMWTSFVLGVVTIVGGIVVGPFVIPIVLIWALAASVGVWRRSSSPADATSLKRASLPA